jgi:transcriptional regulator with XRE-family HTH domain
LARVDLGAALAIIRSSTKLSQLELATLLGWSQSAVARVESGQRDTLYDVRRLFEVADALDMPRSTLIPMLMGDPHNFRYPGDETYDMNLSRRKFGGALLGLAASAGLDQVQIPTHVDAAHIRYFHASVEKLYGRDQNVGGGALARDGLRLYYRARRMLDEASYTEATARQLMSAAGEIAVCVGWLCYDADDQDTARLLYAEARLLADQAGDDQLAIRALEKMALQLSHISERNSCRGYARQAVQLSRRAAELARTDVSPQLHALLAAREAMAHSAAGNPVEFSLAISRAWREMDKDATGAVPTWLQFVNPSEIAIHEARGRWNLGDPGAAADLYRSSLTGELSSRNVNNYRATLAAALAASGDISAAVTEGMVVLPALQEGRISSPRTISRLKIVRRAAENHRQGAEFCERYDLAERTV